MKILIKNGLELTAEEKLQIKESLSQEFKVGFPSSEKLSKTLFFLLKENNKIVSMCGLLKIYPVFFNGQKYSLMGIVNVISNIKSKGHGKQVVGKIKDYLKSNNLTGIGYCYPKYREFYEKCGFTFITISTQHFVYLKGRERVINQDGQIIFYLDSSDKFMEKVLLDPAKDVFLPSADLW